MSLKRKYDGEQVHGGVTNTTGKSKAMGKFRRSGKWSPEEEALALQLIHEFEAGTLPPSECPNGCTLRSFLSKKLSCAPMRISKKFAKKQIGKVFHIVPSPVFLYNAYSFVVNVRSEDERKQCPVRSLRPATSGKDLSRLQAI